MGAWGVLRGLLALKMFSPSLSIILPHRRSFVFFFPRIQHETGLVSLLAFAMLLLLFLINYVTSLLVGTPFVSR